MCNRPEKIGDTCPTVFYIYFNGYCLSEKLVTIPEKSSHKGHWEFVTVFINLEVQSIYRFLFVELVRLSTDVAHFKIEPTRELVKQKPQSTWKGIFFTAFKLLKNAFTRNI